MSAKSCVEAIPLTHQSTQQGCLGCLAGWGVKGQGHARRDRRPQPHGQPRSRWRHGSCLLLHRWHGNLIQAWAEDGLHTVAEPWCMLATVVEQRGQLAQAQAGRGHRLWGELPSAEAGCDAHEADDSAQLLQPRARRSRRPYVPPPTAAPAPAAQQPQQPAQRHWQLPRPGKLDEEDGVSDDELILLGSG